MYILDNAFFFLQLMKLKETEWNKISSLHIMTCAIIMTIFWMNNEWIKQDYTGEVFDEDRWWAVTKYSVKLLFGIESSDLILSFIFANKSK